MFLHANVVRVKEGKNNKTFSDKRKPFKWQRKKEIRGSIYKGEKSAHLRAAHNIPSTFIVESVQI